MAKGLAKCQYSKNIMKKGDKNFTRNEYSLLMKRFEHLFGGAHKLTKKLIKYF